LLEFMGEGGTLILSPKGRDWGTPYNPLSFWYFWLTIQNTTTSQVRSLFSVGAVFISFCPWRAAAAAAAAAAADFAAAAARPHPTPPPSWGRESTKKKGSALSLRGLSTAPQLRTLSLERGRGQGVGVVRVSVWWGGVRSVRKPGLLALGLGTRCFLMFRSSLFPVLPRARNSVFPYVSLVAVSSSFSRACSSNPNSLV
jgi:hypothetical protein